MPPYWKVRDPEMVFTSSSLVRSNSSPVMEDTSLPTPPKPDTVYVAALAICFTALILMSLVVLPLAVILSLKVPIVVVFTALLKKLLLSRLVLEE